MMVCQCFAPTWPPTFSLLSLLNFLYLRQMKTGLNQIWQSYWPKSDQYGHYIIIMVLFIIINKFMVSGPLRLLNRHDSSKRTKKRRRKSLSGEEGQGQLHQQSPHENQKLKTTLFPHCLCLIEVFSQTPLGKLVLQILLLSLEFILSL